MRVVDGPLAGTEVEWVDERVHVPFAYSTPVPTVPDTYYIPRIKVDVYIRVRPPFEQGDDFYRYVGRQ